jgi:hypothetical protein
MTVAYPVLFEELKAEAALFTPIGVAPRLDHRMAAGLAPATVDSPIGHS